MRFRMILAGSAVCLLWLAVPASSQTSQVSKTWEVGRSLDEQLDPFVRHIERTYGREDILGDYMQRVEDGVAAAAGITPHEIRITRGFKWYRFLLPQGVLYISEGLLERISSEGELVGLLAHELGHELNPKATRNSTGNVPLRPGTFRFSATCVNLNAWRPSDRGEPSCFPKDFSDLLGAAYRSA